jgi:L-ascorbate metabolism protein UlaG (beta-lactamase superfamily)
VTAAAAASITYVGHGSVLLEAAGARVLTDPLLRRWAGPLRRYVPLPDPASYSAIDVLLLSHLHIDHVDRASLRLLARDVVVLVPPPGATTLRRLRFADVREVHADDVVEVAGVRIVVTPARHVVRRYPLAPASDGVGFVVQGGGATVYYAGDTGWFADMGDIAAAALPAGNGLDVALLPISGWGPTLDTDEHLTPLAAARCLALLRPTVAVPVHWGTYYPPAMSRFWRKDTAQYARAFERYARRLAPSVEVRILTPGQTTAVAGAQASPAGG